MNLELTLLAIELYDGVPFSIVQIAEPHFRSEKTGGNPAPSCHPAPAERLVSQQDTG